MVIYKAEFPNGKVYIGKSKNFQTRKYQHIWSSKRRNHNHILMARAIKKYGSENIKWEVLYECDNSDELHKKEIEFIKEFNSINHNYGYNMVCGDKEDYVIRENFDIEYRVDIIKKKLKSNGHDPNNYVIIDDVLSNKIIEDYSRLGIRGLSKKYKISRQRLRRFMLSKGIKIDKNFCVKTNSFIPTQDLTNRIISSFNGGSTINQISESENLTILLVSRILHDSGVRKSKRFNNGKRYDGKQPKKLNNKDR